jgi:anti-sigma regulatory factor (Ser/Thr protein kinase)
MKTVTLAELSERVAPQSAEQTQEVLDSVFREIHTELSQGNVIQLPYPVTLAIGEGNRMAAAVPASTGMPELALPSADHHWQIMYAVGTKDFFTDIAARRLSGSRSSVSVVEGQEEAVNNIKQQTPDLLIIDAGMEGAADLIRTIKSDKSTSLVSTILTYGDGDDPNKVTGLRVCEDEWLVEPYEFNELISLAQSELRRSSEERSFFVHEIHFQFQTTEQTVEDANELANELLAQIDGMSEENCAAMGVAYREAVDNAARHGNKNQERKIIDTIYLVDQEKVTITVEDEGDGFDTELYITRGKDGNAVARARQRAQEGRVGGLGIMLMLKCVDDLQYNTTGNQIRLTKFIR